MRSEGAELPASRLPRQVREAIESEIGELRSITKLNGLSGRTVVAAHGQHGTRVAKGPVNASEVAVATTLRDDFAAGGVPMVDATIVPVGNRIDWLLFTYLPFELPRDRWGADHDVIEVMRAVHALPTQPVARISGRYVPVWDSSLTDAALEALNAPASLGNSLSRLARRCQYLFDPLVVVSADPNPLNWRLSTAEDPVLIDWERLTIAHPAIDLGILMPGLGNAQTARRIAREYGDHGIEEIDVLRAKAWSLVEFAAMSPSGTDAAALIGQVREGVIDQLTALSA